MIIDTVPVWALFFVTVAFVLLSVEIGFRLGRTVRGKGHVERESPASSISGVILGLLAFMLAFTFGIVFDRYDSKKALVREEANALRTTFHRADLLQEPDRGKTKDLLQSYVDQRIAAAQSSDVQIVARAVENAARMQRQLWDTAVANARIDMDSDVGALFVESVNEIEDLHARRVGLGLHVRIPTAIWAALLGLLTLGMVSLGYHTAIADSYRSRATPILAISFSLVIALIAALDNPVNNLVPVSQRPLVDVLAEMKSG